MHRVFVWTVSLGVGALAGGSSYLFGSKALLLTATVALSYALLARLAIRHPDIVYEETSPTWTVGRWSGLSAGFIFVVAFFGVSTTLPIADALQLSLRILLFGAGWAMWALGVAYAREKAPD